MAQVSDSGSLDAFLSLLKRELEGFNQFLKILQQEQGAIAGGDADSLIALAQSKNEKVLALAQLAEERNRFLTAQVGSANQAGMDAWLARFDPAGKLGAAKLWQDLVAVARSAKDLNQSNGQTINIRLAHNQRALAILMGANTSTANLYGKDGQAYAPPSSSSSRPLGKA